MPHTPGPWQISGGNQIWSEGGQEFIATIYGFDTQEKRSNARLIVAAPELLAACVEFVKQHEGNSIPEQMYLIMKAAVYKATK